MEGDEIEVSNARGVMLAGVRITDGVTQGVVIIATGAGLIPALARRGSRTIARVTPTC